MDTAPTPTLDIARLRETLPLNGLGHPLIYDPEIPSTNSLAMERIAQGIALPGTIVLTDAQPQGRGRQGRGWITLPGQQILISVIVDLPFAPQWIVMAASVAALDALAAVGIPDDRAGIKWPNDILIDGRKVAGILIETTGNGNKLTGVVGMGMNVNGSLAPWPEIATRATTLADALNHPFEREAIIVAFLASLGAIYAQLAADAGDSAKEDLWARWRERLVMLGRATTVHQGAHLLAGVAEDVAADGTLILRLEDGSRTLITWGDVESTAD